MSLGEPLHEPREPDEPGRELVAERGLRAEAYQVLDGDDEGLRRPDEHGWIRRDALGIRFKRVPVAPTIAKSGITSGHPRA